MKLQQLRFLCEVANRGFSISAAAAALFTSQPGISRQISLLEDELGVILLVRRGNKLLGLTEAGAKIHAIATRALDATETIRRIAKDFDTPSIGSLTVATTHTHARFSLAKVIKAFAKLFPDVDVRILLGLPNQISEWISSGEADVGIATRPSIQRSDIALIPCYAVGHSLVALASHPILRCRRLTMRDIARYPLIAYDDSHEISRVAHDKFRSLNLSPRIVMHANDSDVIKTYVAAGLGIAIIPTIAFDANADPEIRAVDMGRLFDPTIAYAVVRNTIVMRTYAYKFLQMVSPKLRRHEIEMAVEASLTGGAKDVSAN